MVSRSTAISDLIVTGAVPGTAELFVRIRHRVSPRAICMYGASLSVERLRSLLRSNMAAKRIYVSKKRKQSDFGWISNYFSTKR